MPVRSAKAYVNQFLTLLNTMYNHNVYLYPKFIREEWNIGKYTGGGRVGTRCEDGSNMRIVISHSLVNSTKVYKF